MSNKKILEVGTNNSGERLDRFISNNVNELSRTLVQKLIKENSVLVNKKHTKPGYKVKLGDKIFVTFPEPKELNIKGEKIKLDIAFEDKDLIVVNKPQGMVTHPASGIYEGTLVNALLYHCKDSLSGINGVLRPGIVHRLDKETSGLIIVCKNDKSHKEIAKEFKERKIKKSYLAIVHGKVQYDKGTINKPIGRHKIHREKMAVVEGGRDAVTHFKVLKRVEAIHELPLPDKFTFLECMPETGRTHQIRVHLASIGHPIVGDKTYGGKYEFSTSNFELRTSYFQMMLHAYKLVFTHPGSKKEIKLESKLPERFSKWNI